MADKPMLVLVPETAETTLRPLVAKAVEIHTYRYATRTLAMRIARRAGLLSDTQIRDRIFRTPDPPPWEKISALWCGSEVQMSDDEAIALLARMPALKQVYWQRTGLDGLPIPVFEAQGIHVIGSRDLSSRWVAEAAVACIAADAKFLTLAARNRIPTLDHFTRGFGGLRITVVGTGRIGCTVAQLASTLGMRVTGITRDPNRTDANRAGFAELRRFPDDLIDTACKTDYLVLALPATEATRGLVDTCVLQALGPSGVLVNLARPGIVDEAALLDALRRGALHAAYVSRLESSTKAPWHPRLPSNLFLTFNREAHVAEKLLHAARQFAGML